MVMLFILRSSCFQTLFRTLRVARDETAAHHSPEQSPCARPLQPFSLPLAPHGSFSSPHGGGKGWPFVLQPGFEPQ